MTGICRWSLILIIIKIRLSVCRRPMSNISSSELSHRVFSKPFIDDTSTTVQINRGARLPLTRIFYSSIANNFDAGDSNDHVAQAYPTQPTSSLLSQGNNRRRKAPRKPLSTGKPKKYCLTCLIDFKNKFYNTNDACLNPLKNITEAELRFLNQCPETSQFCQTEIYTINGVLSGLERRCSVRCKDRLCFQRSYGTETESCSYCCSMLDQDSIDEESIKKCPTTSNSQQNQSLQLNRHSITLILKVMLSKTIHHPVLNTSIQLSMDKMIRRKLFTKRLFVITLAFIGVYCIIWVYDAYTDANDCDFSHNLSIEDTNAQKCSIPSLNVHAPEITKYLKKMDPLDCPASHLDLIETQNGIVKFKSGIIDQYPDLQCTIEYVLRLDDYVTKMLPAEEQLNAIQQEIKLEYDYFEANCKVPSAHQSFNKIFASVARNEKRADELKSQTSENEFNLNLLFYGFDSLSRVHFQRKLPKTYELLTRQLNAIVLKQYNIVGDGSPQALIPILCGKSEPELPLTLKNKPKSHFVDVYPFIWRNFSEHGYLTQYGEDTPFIGTFTYRMKGFNKQPTDLYMRPYYLRAWKKHFRSNNYCYAGRPRHQIMMDWASEFFSTYKDVPKYSFNFYTEISHDDFNLVQIADNDIFEFFTSLDQQNVFNNTIGILMSDHGARFSSMRSTLQGKYEERLPFFSFILPKWFAKRFPNAYNNMRKNAETRLLTPFDIYSTVMTILTHFNKGQDVKRHVDYDSKLPRSLSIFEHIPLNRTCKDANIDNHWCTCLNWVDLSGVDAIVIKAAHSLTDYLNSMNANYTDQCNKLSVKQITRAQKIEPEKDLLHFKQSADANGFVADLSDKSFDKIDNELYQIQLITTPGDAMYEATIHYNTVNKEFTVKESEISRINMYGDQDWCIHDSLPNLRKYCHCAKEKS